VRNIAVSAAASHPRLGGIKLTSCCTEPWCSQRV
jgi:hypothetical protein